MDKYQVHSGETSIRTITDRLQPNYLVRKVIRQLYFIKIYLSPYDIHYLFIVRSTSWTIIIAFWKSLETAKIKINVTENYIK